MAAITLSVVTSLYQSARHLEEFCHRVSDAARTVTPNYEILLVNDGSPDDSLAVALAIQRRDARVRILDLSRNFGHHAALLTGLRHARGDLVFMIDSDLEEAPEWLREFHARLDHTGADVAYGVQRARKGGWFERASGWLFYKIVSTHLGLPVPPNAVTARLMRRRFVEALLQFGEREHTILSLCAITGFAQEPVPVEKLSHAPTTYSLARRVAVLVNSITSFSSRPLILVFYLGCLILALSGIAATVLMWRRLVYGIDAPGYASLVVSVWFLGGLTVFSIGLVGIYLAKVFVEVKQRPTAIVRAEYPPPTDDVAWDEPSRTARFADKR